MLQRYIQNTVVKRGDHYEIHIRRRNGELHVAKVDADDFQKIATFSRRWSLLTGSGHSEYACTTRREGERTVTYALHRVIVGGVPPGHCVMFGAGGSLDCRKANLKVVPIGVQTQQRHRPALSATGERCIYKYWNTYEVKISVNGREIAGRAKTLAGAVALRDRLLKEHGYRERDGRKLLVEKAECLPAAGI